MLIFSFLFSFLALSVNSEVNPTDDYSLSHLTSISDEAYAGMFKQRQLSVTQGLVNGNNTLNLPKTILLQNVSDFQQQGIVENFTLYVLDTLPEQQDVDFYITELVRLIYLNRLSPDIEHEAFKVLQTIPLWISKGDNLRVYWSENHMIMFCSCRLLLEQRYGNKAFIPKDDKVKEKVLWWLKMKIEYGFFEHNSHYLRYTLSALLNLYDFIDDPEVHELANLALDRLFKDFVHCFNSAGHCLGATSRGIVHHYISPWLKSQHLISHVVLGTPLVLNTFQRNVHIAEAALVTTTYVPYSARFAWKEKDYLQLTFGVSPVTLTNLASEALSQENDRTIAGMSMGGYAHKDFIKPTLTMVNNLKLWDHKLFKEFSFFSSLPTFLYRSIGSLGEAVTSGSLLHSKYKMWKNDGATLSSLEDFMIGKKGFEQVALVAGLGDVTVLPVSAIRSESALEIEHGSMNNQLPKIVQEENIAVAVYNPNNDLNYFYKNQLDVLLSFPFAQFDSVKKRKSWLFGERMDNYVAVHVPCEFEVLFDVDLIICEGKSQAWVLIVGNHDTHGDFKSFTASVIELEISYSRVRRCSNAQLKKKDEILVENEFCQDIGNIHRLIIFGVFSILGLLSLCYGVKICCSKSRSRSLEEEIELNEEKELKSVKSIDISL